MPSAKSSATIPDSLHRTSSVLDAEDLPAHVRAMYLDKAAAINKLQSAFRGHRHRIAHLNLSKPVHLQYERTISMARLSRRKFAFALLAHLIYLGMLCAVVILQRGATVNDRLLVESAMKMHFHYPRW